MSHGKRGPFRQGLIAILCCLHFLPFSIIPSYQIWFYLSFFDILDSSLYVRNSKKLWFNNHGSPWTVNFEDFRVTTFWLLLSPWLLLLLLHTLLEFLSTLWVKDWIAQPPCSPSTWNSLQFLCPLVLLRRYLSHSQLSRFMNCRRHDSPEYQSVLMWEY